jgi:hypothetical protein
MKIFTVDLVAWKEQTEYVQDMASVRTGLKGELMSALATWMEELAELIGNDPVIVATPGQAKWLRKLQDNLSIQVVTPPPFPDGKKLTGVRVIDKEHFPGGPLRSVSIKWEGEEDLTEEDLADE